MVSSMITWVFMGHVWTEHPSRDIGDLTDT